MKTAHYIENADIHREWERWKETGTPSDKLVEQIYQIAKHLLTHRNFAGYSYHEKQDMIQEAVLKCLANLKNFKPEKGIIFSYFTRCCWTAFVVYLAKYYKGINRRRKEILLALENLDETQLGARDYLKKMIKNLDDALTMTKGGEKEK